MTKWTKHYIVEMNESMIQQCILCGEIISDYRNAMYPIEDGPPKGFAAGEIYVGGKNPTVFLCMKPNVSDDQIVDCSKK